MSQRHPLNILLDCLRGLWRHGSVWLRFFFGFLWGLLRRVPLRQLLLLSIVVILSLLVSTCSPRVPILNQVTVGGQITMATINSRTTYYLGPSGPEGFEYALAKLFAQQLGVKLNVLVLHNRKQVLEAVRSGRAQFAAGLAITPQRKKQMRFTPVYLDVKHQVVYHTRKPRPDNIKELSGELTVAGYSSIAQWLHGQYPDLEFSVDKRANTEALLSAVAKGEIKYTMTGSRLVQINQRFFPDLRVAFSLQHKAQLAWAFPQQKADKLYKNAVAFIKKIRDSEQFSQIRNRYFGHIDRLGFVGGKTFARQVETRLSKWKNDFIKAGKSTGFDWRLLAAISYQESHWDPDAVSPTKVRGLMMLTKPTARRMGVEDRTDPLQSISGGARYFALMYKRLGDIAEKIKDPDRTWMALAAYNLGLGHVLDARRLVASNGGNPDSWFDVRNALPKLTQERYFRHTKHGYARGRGAVDYVGNIRAYYDILLWMTSDTKMPIPKALTTDKNTSPSPSEKALNIHTPTL